MKDFTVLLTGCSYLSKDIVESLKDNEDGVGVSVIGVDCNKDNLLHENVDVTKVVPRATSSDYIDTLLRLCDEYKVDIVLPNVTAELPVIARHKDEFEKRGIKVSVSDSEVIATAVDKIAFYKAFSHFMPRQIEPEYIDELEDFSKKIKSEGEKICCKLSDKQGALGFAVVDDVEYNNIRFFNNANVPHYIHFQQMCDIIRMKKADERIIVQEYKRGKDYSVCVLADHGKVLHKVGYRGDIMWHGAVMAGEIMAHKKAYYIAENVTESLGLDGNACFDFIIDGEDAWLLEVNPRLNATVGFVVNAGANLPYWRCKKLLGYDVPKDAIIEYGLKMHKYYESEYFL